MKQARLRITPPAGETIPVHRAIQSAGRIGDAVLLSGGADLADPTELFSIEGPAAVVRSALEAESGVRSVDVLSTAEGETYVYVREQGDERAIADVLTTGTLVVTLPIRFRADGAVDLTVLGAGANLREALSVVREVADVTVLSVRESWSASPDSLTDRQREVLAAAYEAGYYDYPRRATQAEVASTLGVSGSTVAEHLRHAEAALVASALGRTEAES
ncbi:helix-turn-helix domain-containing protein [Halolamina sediminis]|jgi:predicted DNA binding protein|uniref:helix-turn-helix domain-containing protein n=1 Tax=Halolamina sediminis TaxID=1480675 RepID=UPI0006B689CF|nr:helix-turn-helix domain-containing protein [Halolamina sediminis]